MTYLVLNCGSSSIKFESFAVPSLRSRLRGQLEAIGTARARLRWNREERPVTAADHDQALTLIAERLAREGLRPRAVGHRVVHGGERFHRPVVVDDAVLAAIEAATPLAPLHNPVNVAGIRLARRLWPEADQIAAFDTAFHQTLPPRAFRYAVPTPWYRDHGVRRYGFHGLSHAHVAKKAACFLGRPLARLRLIVLHLGNGASACAIENGRSVDTSMGMTPLEGLVMGSRCGDLDPGVLLHLLRQRQLSPEALERALNHASGLRGLCGHSDIRAVHRAAATDSDARLALELFSYRVRKYIGAYLAVLGRLDALIFTGGIGENDAEIRAACLEGLEAFGLVLDPARNRQPRADVLPLHAPESKAAILAIVTDEAREIAENMAALLNDPTLEPPS